MPASEQAPVSVLCTALHFPVSVINLHSLRSRIDDRRLGSDKIMCALSPRALIRRRTTTVLFRSIRLAAQKRRNIQVFQIRLLHRRMTIADRLLAHDRRTLQLAVIDFAVAIALHQLDRQLL